MGRVIIIVIVLLLVGCGKHYWRKPDATATDFQTDNFTCARTALGQQETAEWRPYQGFGMFKGTKINGDLYQLCMRERGWSREKHVAPPANAYRGITDEL